ncbi:hypothetical protein [Mycobacterium sp. GA-2829]|uniref:hypothetical protein n=1 Tax=Mycobacterium sp. GA-2829 TaxID=1772283 RepID=UPI0018D1FC70|nr:hypothetical protein [Mycobacterium sp. GA-2829]
MTRLIPNGSSRSGMPLMASKFSPSRSPRLTTLPRLRMSVGERAVSSTASVRGAFWSGTAEAPAAGAVSPIVKAVAVAVTPPITAALLTRLRSGRLRCFDIYYLPLS